MRIFAIEESPPFLFLAFKSSPRKQVRDAVILVVALMNFVVKSSRILTEKVVNDMNSLLASSNHDGKIEIRLVDSWT